MRPPNPADKLRDAPSSDLIVVLLKQFRRLIEAEGIELRVPTMQALADAAEAHQPLPEPGEAVMQRLHALITESQQVLRDEFGLSFAESLATSMTEIGGWETTAEFIDIANTKTNAELRISAGGSLLAFLGDDRYSGELLAVIAEDAGANDVDATFARRALSHLTGIDPTAERWHEKTRTALAGRS